MIILDVDGTLTDGKVYYYSDGSEGKAFNIKDGLIIAAMVKLGYTFAIVTGRESEIVKRRMEELGVKLIFQGVKDKESFVDKLLAEQGTDYDNCCYIGDDLNDYRVMSKCGIKGCPSDACKEIKEIADFVSENKAGDGAVREILEQLLIKDGKWVLYEQLFY